MNQPAAPGPTGTPTQTRTSASGDVSLDIQGGEVKGTVYEPTALDTPGMPLVDPKRPTTIDKQRAQVASAKDPVVKQAQAAVLTTMLYRESKAQKDKEQEKWKEARQILLDVWQQVGDKAVDEVTAHLLGCLQIRLGDWAGAEKAWAKLVELAPKDKETPSYRAWLAYAQLKQFKTADAVASVGTDKLDDKQPELAYVTAWAKWRAGDGAGAWAAIAVAAKASGDALKRDELGREVILIASRTPTPADQAQALLATAFATSTTPKQKQMQVFEVTAKLGLTGYGTAGRWADGIATLEKAATLLPKGERPSDAVVIRYQQADFAVRLDDPDAVARYAKQAVAALGECGDKCSARDKSDTFQLLYVRGRVLHNLYATANDKRFYQPTHDLYEMTAPGLDATNQAQEQKDIKALETTLKNMKKTAGTHDGGAIGTLLAYHAAEVTTCYEHALGSNPKLGGTLTVVLESDNTGVIKGAAAEPAPGAAGLPAVSGCVVERAKQWKLPQRAMAGNTRIKLTYTLAVKK